MQQKITDCCIRGLTMVDSKNQTALTVRGDSAALRNKTSQVSAIQRTEAGAADYVPHVSAGQVKLIVIVAEQNKRYGECNALLIEFLFDGCLRVSEALGVRPVGHSSLCVTAISTPWPSQAMCGARYPPCG